LPEPPISASQAIDGRSPPLHSDAAIAHLERRSLAWLEGAPSVGNNLACATTCHTTHALMFSLRLAPSPSAATPALRSALDARVALLARGEATPFYGDEGSDKARQSLATEAVLNASVLGTTQALDAMWRYQGDDGAWEWLDFGLQPWEADNAPWGAALAAWTVAKAPDDYRARPHVAAAVARLKTYWRRTLPHARLHDRMLLSWEGGLLGILDRDEQRAIADEVVAAQEPDGGWALTSLGFSSGASDVASDGYGSAFALLALCHARHLVAADVAIARGVKWLHARRSADGTWRGRSLNKDEPFNHALMSDAATAYARAALALCTKGLR
jgi:hypothetical protein